MKILRICSVLIVTGLATACGGGGGSAFVATPTAEINSGNAQAIAGAAVSGNLALVNAVGSTGVGISSGPNGGGVRGAVSRILAGGWTRTAIRSVTPEAAGVEPEMAFGPEIQDCFVSGTASVSGNVSDPDTLSPGDSITATFAACDDGDGFVMNGTLQLRVTSFSDNADADTGTFHLVADTTFSNLRVTSGTETGTLNGTASLTLDTTDINQEITRLVADSLRFTSNGDVLQLNLYDVTGVTFLDTNQYTLDVTGYFQDSSVFTGTVRLNTVTPFAGDVGDYPSEGYLTITGANESAVDVESLDAIQARLHLDADGDGVAEETTDVNWSELTGGP